MADLDVIHRSIRSCRDCSLHLGRTNAVPGEGSPDAEIMFVGEGPGFNEDKQARPFIGAAGQFLNALLSSIGLVREDVFITNIVKCRPPNNRDPFRGEAEACSHYLDEQIEAIKPKIIVPLGRHALARWFPNESIGRVRAKPKQFGDITLFPLYHPAAALHNGGLRQTIEEDFAKLGELLKQLLSGGTSHFESAPPLQSGIISSSPQPAEPSFPDHAVEQTETQQTDIFSTQPSASAAREPSANPEVSNEPEASTGSRVEDHGEAESEPQQLSMF